MRIHPIFHISLLELATSDATLQQDVRDIDPEIQEPLYQVERILRERTVRGQKQYLVRREGYDHTEDSWQISEHFESQRPIEEFRRQRRSQDRATKVDPGSKRWLEDTGEGKRLVRNLHTEVLYRSTRRGLKGVVSLEIL